MKTLFCKIEQSIRDFNIFHDYRILLSRFMKRFNASKEKLILEYVNLTLQIRIRIINRKFIILLKIENLIVLTI